MAKYILVYRLEGHQELGGGIYTEEFGIDVQSMHNKVQELVKEHKDSFKVIYAGFLQTEYEYETVEYAVRVEPKIIK